MEEEKVNNYAFARILDRFATDEVEYLRKQVDAAIKICNDPEYKWADEQQKVTGRFKMEKMNARLMFFERILSNGKELVKQHEELTDVFAKVYQKWYDNISNNGKQETEMMEMQATILNEIFTDIFNVLKPLKLNIKPPSALNM